MLYGPVFKDVAHEMFGDGIMSASTCPLTSGKVEDPPGVPRMVMTLNGKWLQYKNLAGQTAFEDSGRATLCLQGFLRYRRPHAFFAAYPNLDRRVDRPASLIEPRRRLTPLVWRRIRFAERVADDRRCLLGTGGTLPAGTILVEFAGALCGQLILSIRAKGRK